MHRAAVDADCPFASGLQRSGSRLRPRENPRPPPSCPGWNEKGGQRIYEPLVRQITVAAYIETRNRTTHECVRRLFCSSFRAPQYQESDKNPVNAQNLTAPDRAAHGQTAHGGDPDAVFLAHRKRGARHESGPGSQDREVFADGR